MIWEYSCPRGFFCCSWGEVDRLAYQMQESMKFMNYLNSYQNPPQKNPKLFANSAHKLVKFVSSLSQAGSDVRLGQV